MDRLQRGNPLDGATVAPGDYRRGSPFCRISLCARASTEKRSNTMAEPRVQTTHGGPKRAMIKAALTRLIVEQRLQPGDRLPGQNELAARFGTTVLTIHRALAELESERRSIGSTARELLSALVPWPAPGTSVSFCPANISTIRPSTPSSGPSSAICCMPF